MYASFIKHNFKHYFAPEGKGGYKTEKGYRFDGEYWVLDETSTVIARGFSCLLCKG